MSMTRRIAFGAMAAWFGRGINILLGLVLLPVLFRRLPPDELGVWLLLGQSWATMGILDFGFGVTFTRRIALVWGKHGGHTDRPLSPEGQREIADLVACGRRIYRLMACAVFVLSATGGCFYVNTLQLQHVSHLTVWIAWVVLCADNAFGVWGTVWTCLLQGIGYVGWDAIIASFISTATISVQIGAVFAGGGVVTLAVIATLAALWQRLLLRRLARRRRPELFALEGHWNPTVLQGMRGLAFRAWLTALGAVLVFNTDNFFIASAEGATDIPAYRACYVLVLNVQMLAITFGGASSVFISHLWQAGDLLALHRLVRRNLRLGLLIMLCGGAWLLNVGGSLFDVWLGAGKFVGYPTLLVFVVLFVLDVHTFIVAVSARATESEVFGFWSLAAGLLKLLLSWLLIQRFQLLGVALGTLLAQLLTTYWYTNYRGFERLRIAVGDHLRLVLLPCAGIFAVVFCGDGLLLRLVGSAPAPVRVAASAALTGAAFGAGCWWFVLAKAERQGLLSRAFPSRAPVPGTP